MKHDTSKWTIETIFQMEASLQLLLQPDFQRFYIWSLAKEQLFVDSILRGYPVPPIWLWKRKGSGRKRVHEVVDGQQRLTCLRRFVNNRFPYKYPGKGEADKELEALDGHYFSRAPRGSGAKAMPAKIQDRVMEYMVPYVSVQTDKRDLILDIFYRLNKSATNLTPQELRNAFYNGEFKSYIYDKTAKLQDDSYWGAGSRVFERKTTDRMADQQYLSDLVVALIEHEPQHQSSRLDEYYDTYDKAFPQKAKINKRVNRALRIIKKAMPGPTRFTRNLSDFYSLFLLVDELAETSGIRMESDKNVKALRETLAKFEADYTLYLDKRPRGRRSQTVFEEYRETIVGRQREKEVRENRQRILRELLEPGVERRKQDNIRLFSEEQKLYIWQAADSRVCEICKLQIDDYDDYEPDHIEPWSKGGPTTISNGRITHKRCNRSRQDRKSK